MRTRITADIDNKDKDYLIFCINKAFKHIKEIQRLMVMKSANKNYHLVIWTNKYYNKQQIYKIRKKIGDDERRIKNDKYRKIGEQTLFDKKTKVNRKVRKKN